MWEIKNKSLSNPTKSRPLIYAGLFVLNFKYQYINKYIFKHLIEIFI